MTIDVSIRTEDETEAAVCQAYWRQADDGSWAQTIADVRRDYHLTQAQIGRIIEGCTASSDALRCPECKQRYVLKTRTHFGELSRSSGPRCSSCQAAIEEAKRDAARAERERRAEIIADEYTIYDSGTVVRPEDLLLSEAVALHALLSDPAMEDQGFATPIEGWPKERPFATPPAHIELLRALVQQSLLFAHPDSSTAAFAWDGEKQAGFYLDQAGFYVRGTGPTAKRAYNLVEELTTVFREGPWPKQWLTGWADLWDQLALADASVYLDRKLTEHRLTLNQGDGTMTALKDALASFSLGQVYNIIFRAARDSAAYYQRGGINMRQAANSTVGRITASTGRARANDWDLKPFRRDWHQPLSAVGETFFTSVMWIPDMMTVARRDAQAPRHAFSAADVPVPTPRDENVPEEALTAADEHPSD